MSSPCDPSAENSLFSEDYCRLLVPDHLLSYGNKKKKTWLTSDWKEKLYSNIVLYKVKHKIN